MEFTTPGDVMDWTQNNYAKGAARQIIIETINGRRFYVKGSTVYDLTLSQHTGKQRAWTLENTEDLPNAVIGQPWMPGPPALHELADPISKVSIGERIAPQEWLGEGGQIDAEYDKRGEDPFAAADKLLDSLLEGEKDRPQPTALTEVLAPTSLPPKSEKKFDHSESLISYWRRKRTPEIKQMPKRKDKRRARLAAVGDYLTANIAETDFYGQYKSKNNIEVVDDIESGVSNNRIQKVADRLRDAKGDTGERTSRSAKLLRKLGSIGISHVIGAGQALSPEAQALMAKPSGYKTEDDGNELEGEVVFQAPQQTWA